MAQHYLASKILFPNDLEVSFKSEIADQFQQANPKKVAVLATSEYEGIFKNGGIGTHYKTLSEQLTQDGWYVILLLCQTLKIFNGKSTLPAVEHIFSNHETSLTLNLQPVHLAALDAMQHNDIDYQSYACFLFTQAIAHQFSTAQIYVEFHEMNGTGYHTIQAKRSQLLGDHCVIAVTMHSGNEWVYEANEWFAELYPGTFNQLCEYERYTFENADLAFFPSQYLKARVESYGWKTDHAKLMPYFIPIITKI
jgi:O-antigen biosynthesis protein